MVSWVISLLWAPHSVEHTGIPGYSQYCVLGRRVLHHSRLGGKRGRRAHQYDSPPRRPSSRGCAIELSWPLGLHKRRDLLSDPESPSDIDVHEAREVDGRGLGSLERHLDANLDANGPMACVSLSVCEHPSRLCLCLRLRLRLHATMLDTIPSTLHLHRRYSRSSRCVRTLVLRDVT